MFWQKSCPRCKGDLYQDSDGSGIYVACFQCGHYLSVIGEVALPKRLLRHSIETTIDGREKEGKVASVLVVRPDLCKGWR
jgi:hypothetical protein